MSAAASKAQPKARTLPQVILDWAKSNGIEREEVYQHGAPGHWARDRCMMLEYDEQFLHRIHGLMRRRLK